MTGRPRNCRIWTVTKQRRKARKARKGRKRAVTDESCNGKKARNR